MKSRKMTALFALTLCLNLGNSAHAGTVNVKKNDPAMVKAVKKAHKTLDNFLALKKNPRPGMEGFKLKVRLRDGNKTEHMWVAPFKITKHGFIGALANTPVVLKNVRHGQLIVFKRRDVTDWGYVRNGKQYGSFTICVLLQKMPKDKADYYRKNHGFQC